MNLTTHIGFFDLLIFLGVFQGLLISWFFIRNGLKDRKANLFQGLLLLFLSLAIFEELLNNTGYIVFVLPVMDFSEFLNFTFGPLFYLYVRSTIDPGEKKKVWPQFILAGFWLLYMTFYFIQPDEVKYNSYVETKHPDWEYLQIEYIFSDDPLGIRHFCNEILAVQFTVYITASIIILLRRFRSMNQSLFGATNESLIVLRNTTLHFVIIIAVFFVTKFYFGMSSDIGGYWIASYISFMIFATSYQIMKRSDFFNQPHSFLDFPMPKYRKSSLTEEQKNEILAKVKSEMEEKKYFTGSLASLSDLAKRTGSTSHYLSQVINEKLGQNFFEMLAKYRVEEAKKILQSDSGIRLTIEEVAEQVGYNSKSAFNNAFKKLTGQTPSEFRKQGQ